MADTTQNHCWHDHPSEHDATQPYHDYQQMCCHCGGVRVIRTGFPYPQVHGTRLEEGFIAWGNPVPYVTYPPGVDEYECARNSKATTERRVDL